LKTKTAPLLLCLLCLRIASAQVHPSPGTSLRHFSQVGQKVFFGSKPHNDADFQFLRREGIHYILEVHFLPGFTGPEKKKAREYGIDFISVPMNASPVAPSSKHVNEALRIMRTEKYQPVYLHCVLGRDRTGLLMGLYRVYFLGLPPDRGYQEMKASGFRNTWFLKGLKRYFDRHLTPPPEFAALQVGPSATH
jgi:hypothetical protein